MESMPSLGPAHSGFHRKNYDFLASRYAYLGRNWYDFTGRSHKGWPKFPACYVIQDGGITVYVGHTSNLAARMSQHRSGILLEVDNPTIKVRFGMKYGDWAMRELRLIRRLRPKYNTHGCRDD